MEEAVGVVMLRGDTVFFNPRWKASLYAGLFLACGWPLLLSAQTLQLDPTRILSQPLPAAPEPAPEVIAQGYLYLEPNQMRFEALFDATTVLKWAGLPAGISLDGAAQKVVTEALAAKAAEWCLVGTTTPAPGTFLGASMIKGKPGATLPFEEGATLSTREAMVGLIWEFPLPPVPESIVIQWTGYLLDQKSLPIRVFYGAKSEVIEAEAGIKLLKWRSKGKLVMPVPLAAVPQIASLPPGACLWPVRPGFWAG